MVAALVCLAIVTLILLSVFKSSMSQRRQIRLEQRQIQAELLAESGLERAVAKLKNNDSYAGENWIINANQLDTRNAGLVKITVVKQDDRHSVTVAAMFPKESRTQNRATRSLMLTPTDTTKSNERESPDESKITTDADSKADLPE